jgi:MFS family permease
MLVLMPLASTFEAAASLFAIRGVVIGVSWAVVQSYMMSSVTENQRGTIVGFTYTTWGIGVSLGTFIGGELLGAGLLTLPFVAGVISYLASSAALWLFFRKVKPPEEVTRFMPRVSE